MDHLRAFRMMTPRTGFRGIICEEREDHFSMRSVASDTEPYQIQEKELTRQLDDNFRLRLISLKQGLGNSGN